MAPIHSLTISGLDTFEALANRLESSLIAGFKYSNILIWFLIETISGIPLNQMKEVERRSQRHLSSK